MHALAVRFGPVLDRFNTAPPGVFRFPVSVQRTSTAALTGVTVEVSYDDGGTWTVAPVDPAGIVTVTHPAGAAFASLRATATDAGGTRLEQTILRGYGIRS